MLCDTRRVHSRSWIGVWVALGVFGCWCAVVVGLDHRQSSSATWQVLALRRGQLLVTAWSAYDSLEAAALGERRSEYPQTRQWLSRVGMPDSIGVLHLVNCGRRPVRAEVRLSVGSKEWTCDTFTGRRQEYLRSSFLCASVSVDRVVPNVPSGYFGRGMFLLPVLGPRSDTVVVRDMPPGSEVTMALAFVAVPSSRIDVLTDGRVTVVRRLSQAVNLNSRVVHWAWVRRPWGYLAITVGPVALLVGLTIALTLSVVERPRGASGGSA